MTGRIIILSSRRALLIALTLNLSISLGISIEELCLIQKSCLKVTASVESISEISRTNRRLTMGIKGFYGHCTREIKDCHRRISIPNEIAKYKE